MSDSTVGAWGIRLTPVPAVPSLLQPAPPEWPFLETEIALGTRPSGPDHWDETSARYQLRGGHYLEIDRHPLRARLTLAAPTPAEAAIVPHLSSAASTIAAWSAQVPLHAGAFIRDGRAWGVLGDKGAGKTSLLAAVAAQGLGVVSDDVLIYSDAHVLAGPRCVDLRARPAAELATGRGIGFVGTRRRWRVDLPPIPPRTPLAGWIVPAWSDGLELQSVPPAQRLELIPQFRALRLPWSNLEAVLELIGYPTFRWLRPRDLQQLAATAGWLLENLP